MAIDGMRKRNRTAEPALYAVAVVLACGIATLVLQLWRMNFHVPLSFSGDAVAAGTGVKGMIENGWFYSNPLLGAPGTFSALDYPGADLACWVVLKVLAFGLGDWAATMNAFFLLGFPLTAVTGLWALRRLGLSAPAALTASLLYAFLPFHVLRGEAHLFLSAYYALPLLCVLTLELASSTEPPLVGASGTRPLWRDRSAWIVVAICGLVGSSGVYYAFFACFFIAVAGVLGAWRWRQKVRLRAAAIMIGLVIISSAVSLSPFIYHRLTAPPNAQAVVRSPVENEIYSLRIAQMVLPVTGHRVAALAGVRISYNNRLATLNPVMVNESDMAALGLVGTIGFLYLLLLLVFGRRGPEPRAAGSEPLLAASSLSAAGLLLATTGGFSAILAYRFVQIRAYNRISVVLAFFALLAAGSLIDAGAQRLSERPRRYALPIFCAFVLVLGVADQTTTSMVPNYQAIEAQWKALGSLVGQVQSRVPLDGMVFQLPYVAFPENPPVVQMTDYDHFKPYLCGAGIHWSYGAFKGGEIAIWQQATAALPPPQLVAELRIRGFKGIWVDLAGYDENAGVGMVAALRSALGAVPLVSEDGRYVFFSIP